MEAFKQLDIHWVDLEPTRGAETQKQRPCVIIQSDIINKSSKTFIVAPILPGHKDWPFAVNIQPSKMNALDKERHLNIKQLRVVDISRIQKKKKGTLESVYREKINTALQVVFKI